jgi:fatty-acyl-CoA synthase
MEGVSMFIGDWLARRAMLTPKKVALIDTQHANREITYQIWNRSTNQTANFLRQQFDIRKGDRVAVLAMNSVEYLDIWFALGKLGAILQNLNWRLAPQELSGLIIDADPKVLIYGKEFLSAVHALREASSTIKFVALGDKAEQPDYAFGDRLNFGDHPPPEVELCWSDPWVICYTGGTTGTPKGALLTHRSITANAMNTVISWGLTADDVTILNSPLFHSGGLNVFTAPLVYVGGTSIVCREFDIDQTYALLTNDEVSIWFGVPTMFVMMQNHPLWVQADFSHLKLLISGGAPCPLPVFEKFWAKGVDFKTGYGLTEAGPNTFWLPPEDVRRKPGSVGFPLFHIDVKIIRNDGHECDPGEVGELVIRGPHLCSGYWNNPQATAEAIHPLPNDPNGPSWLHTGDLAQHDAEGYFYIVGRSKEMFISGGENVFPAEVESVLHAHPAVAEATVIAISHETWGEVGRAIVVLKPGKVVRENDLLESVCQQLARYKVPKSVVFVDQLPKTGANKVDKKLLAETYGSEENNNAHSESQ